MLSPKTAVETSCIEQRCLPHASDRVVDLRDATYTVSSTGEGVLALPSLLTDDDPEVEYAVHTRGGEAVRIS